MADGDGHADTRAEVVVVGGGHNGLACAAYLAKAGIDVIVVEANERCGGALFSSQHHGYTLEHGAIDHSTILASPIVADLELERHGLRYLTRVAAAAHLFGDGTCLTIDETAQATAASIARIDEGDAQAWLRLAELAGQLLALTSELTAARPIATDLALRAGGLAFGQAGHEIMELATISAIDLANRWFTSPYVRALAVFRSQFSGVAPWEAGTGAVFCLTPGGHGRRLGRPAGGSAALVDALVAAVVADGGRVITGFPAASIRRHGAGWLVAAADGRRVTAERAVVSALAPQDSMLELVEPEAVPPPIRRRFERVVATSDNLSQFSLAAALRDLPPSLDKLPARFAGTQLWLLQSPSNVLDVATAAMTGTLADRPGVLVTFPSIIDPSAAPDGGATVWINGFTTHRLADGDWSSRRDEAVDAIWGTVESCLPGVHERVIESHFFSPDDLSARTRVENPGHHVAATIDQLFAGRPAPGAARHRSGVPGIYLTGAGTNPGPSVSGLPGRAAALAVLDDLGSHRLGRHQLAAAGDEFRRLRRVGKTAWNLRRSREKA